MAELEEEPQGMTERECLQAMTVTLLQMRDWLAVIAKSQSPEAASKVEEIHRQKGIVLDLPEYDMNSTPRF